VNGAAVTTTERKVLALARRWARAKVRSYDIGIYEVKTVKGLDEFDPKHCAWESKSFFADREASLLDDELGNIALSLVSQGKTKDAKIAREILAIRVPTTQRMRKEHQAELKKYKRE